MGAFGQQGSTLPELSAINPNAIFSEGDFIPACGGVGLPAVMIFYRNTLKHWANGWQASQLDGCAAGWQGGSAHCRSRPYRLRMTAAPGRHTEGISLDRALLRIKQPPEVAPRAALKIHF